MFVSQVCSHGKTSASCTPTICALFCMFVSNSNNVYLPIDMQYTIVWLYHKIFLYLSCFIKSSAAINIFVCFKSSYECFSLFYVSSSLTSGSQGLHLFIFEWYWQRIIQNGNIHHKQQYMNTSDIWHLTNSVNHFQFSYWEKVYIVTSHCVLIYISLMKCEVEYILIFVKCLFLSTVIICWTLLSLSLLLSCGSSLL